MFMEKKNPNIYQRALDIVNNRINPDISQGGSSVPKPLTYDYMPYGYPSKSMQTSVLLEEQEIAFTEHGGAYKAVLTDGPILVAGQTYTVNWDGTEYECVCSEIGQYLFIGNLSITAGVEDTGEPFIYAPAANKVFATLDTSPSHSISVTTSTETITPMAEEFLPPTIVTKDEVNEKAAALQPKSIIDSGGYFTSGTVDGALQEIGAELAGINTLLGSGEITS